MAVRKIRYDSDPVLRKKSREIEEVNDRIKELLNDLVDTMYELDGVGLAAPQVGVLRRAVVIDIGDGPIKMVNPIITEKSGDVLDVEGCLSVLDKSGIVERPESLVASFTDENGNRMKIEASGLLARAICHELDHLDGVLYTDRAIKMGEVGQFSEEDIRELEADKEVV